MTLNNLFKSALNLELSFVVSFKTLPHLVTMYTKQGA